MSHQWCVSLQLSWLRWCGPFFYISWNSTNADSSICLFIVTTGQDIMKMICSWWKSNEFIDYTAKFYFISIFKWFIKVRKTWKILITFHINHTHRFYRFRDEPFFFFTWVLSTATRLTLNGLTVLIRMNILIFQS